MNSFSDYKQGSATAEYRHYVDAVSYTHLVQPILMQLDGIEAQLNGDGTYTEQGDLLYICLLYTSRCV